jgi:hypothetical protein
MEGSVLIKQVSSIGVNLDLLSTAKICEEFLLFGVS